jgi:hypothetical protein
MKKAKLLAIILLIGIVAISCKKEGPQGPVGTAGANGTNGNANVILYAFGDTTFSAANLYRVNYYPAGLTSGMVDSSLILAYYKQTLYNAWYPVGGIGLNGNYQTRMFIDPAPPPCVTIRLNNIDGSAYSGADVSWDTVRIFVIPANIFRSVLADKVDLTNYLKANEYLSNR